MTPTVSPSNSPGDARFLLQEMTPEVSPSNSPGDARFLLQEMTPEVSPSNSPGHAPGRMHPINYQKYISCYDIISTIKNAPGYAGM